MFWVIDRKAVGLVIPAAFLNWTMDYLILLIEKWRDIAKRKQKQAVKEIDSNESNYQLGKIEVYNEILEEIEKETSKTGHKESIQGNETNPWLWYDSVQKPQRIDYWDN